MRREINSTRVRREGYTKLKQIVDLIDKTTERKWTSVYFDDWFIFSGTFQAKMSQLLLLATEMWELAAFVGHI